MRRLGWLFVMGVLALGCGGGEDSDTGVDAGPDVVIGSDVITDTLVTDTDITTVPDVDEVPDVQVSVDVAWEPTEAQSAAFEQLVVQAASLIDGAGIPGGSIAVVIDGHAAFGRGMGYKKAGTLGLVTEDTPFQLMSVSKMFVAATAMSLVDDGLVDLNAPLSDVVPFLQLTEPYTAEDITLHQVLSHTAGLGTTMPADADPETLPSLSDPDNLKELFEVITLEMWAPPGAIWLYSNFGYVVAALAVEEAGGGNLFDLAAERIFTPVGMEHATFYPEEAIDLGVTDKHSTNAEGELYPIQATKWDTNIVYAPMAGMYASASDLALWAEYLLGEGEDVLSAATEEAMMGPQADMNGGDGMTYGYGWVQGTSHGVEFVMHNGAGYGYASQLLLVPEHNFAIVALVNADLDFGVPNAICGAAIETMLGFFPGVPADPLPPPSPLEAYTGTYLDVYRYGEMVIDLVEEELVLSFAGMEGSTPLVPIKHQTFAVVLPEAVLETMGLISPTQYFSFFNDDEGAPAYFTNVYGVGILQEPIEGEEGEAPTDP